VSSAAAALAWAMLAIAQAQSFQALGTNTLAYGVSVDGSVVSGTGSGQAFRRTDAGGLVLLGTLAGGSRSAGNGISADGSTVVGNSDAQATRWTAATGMVGLGFLGNGSLSDALGTNGDGSVVVGFSNGDGTTQAFRWTAATGMLGLGFLPGTNSSRSLATNFDGSLVVGDSSLIRGLAFAVKQMKADVRVVGVQAERAPAYYRSWTERRAQSTEFSDTIAEGLATRHAQENNVTEMLDLVDQMQLVSDEEILRAIYRLLIDEHIVAEPAGAASTAALLQSDHLQAGEKVVLIVTGANIEG